MLERVDGQVSAALDAATVRQKLALPRVALRFWRPATNAVFELDIEVAQQLQHQYEQHPHQHHHQQQHALVSAQGSHHHHNYQLPQLQHGKHHTLWQQDDAGLM
jgi:hypothetical protein